LDANSNVQRFEVIDGEDAAQLFIEDLLSHGVVDVDDVFLAETKD
jgi:hypothetical protein